MTESDGNKSSRKAICDRLVQRVETAVRRFIGTKGLPPEESDDLVQDSLIGILDACTRKTEEIKNENALAIAIAKHKYVDAMRRRRKRQQYVDFVDVSSLESDLAKPDVELDKAERLKRLNLVVETELDDSERRLFSARLRGDTYQQIADDLDCHQSTARLKYHAVLAKVRTALERGESS